MKIFNIDWQNFIDRLEAWNAVSTAGRKAFCALRSNDTKPVAQFANDRDLLIENRFLTPPSLHTRVRVHTEAREFSRAVRGMARHRIAETQSDAAAEEYLRDNFTADERRALYPSGYQFYGSEHHLIRQVVDAGWVEGFLAEDNSREWESRHLFVADRSDRLFPNKRVFNATQQLVRQLVKSGGWAPLVELPERMPKMSRELLFKAVTAAVCFVLVFPSIDPKTFNPLIGVWPDIVARMNRPAAAFPDPAPPQDTFHAAFLVEDMTTVLVTAAGEPLRLKSDRSLYVKVRRSLQDQLMSLPEWVVQTAWLRRHAEKRVETAIIYLQALGCIGYSGKRGRDFTRIATDRAHEWLGANPKQQIQRVLTLMKKESARNHRFADPQDYRLNDDDWDDDDDDLQDDHNYWEPHYAVGLLPIVSHELNRVQKDVLKWMQSAWGELPCDDFVPCEEFLQWQSEANNPLLQPKTRKQIGGYTWQPITDELLERRWSDILSEFLATRLLPLGGVRVATDGNGRVLLALTDIGRVMLGQAKDFEYGRPDAGDGMVLIQPNFDVTFLASVPLAEANISRLAERRGHGMGTLFRITRESILRAASTGMAAEQALESLRSVSGQPLPANVEREIAGWFQQCRHVTLRTAVLVHCPDAETAARVTAAAGRKGELLTDTVVELTDERAAKTLDKKLRQTGIFFGKRS